MTDDRHQNEDGGSDDELRELLGAYVLDALEDDERARVERRLSVDPEAQAEVDRLAGTVDMALAADVAEVRPPPDLWDRISAGLPTDELAGRRARRSRSKLGRGVLAVAAAVVAIVAVGVVVAQTDDDPEPLTVQLQRRAEQAAEAAGSRSAELTSAASNATVTIVTDADGRAFVIPQGLPALAADQTYQLWSLDGAQPVSLGLLGPDPTASVVTLGSEPETLAISVEPASGSTAPTTDPVVVGTLA
jgi:anti-sigma-K factor RskA